MVKKEYKYSGVTAKIIGSALTVHQRMRNGDPEIVYDRRRWIEFRKSGLSFLSEIELPIFYGEIEVGKRRVDVLVGNKVIVEIKALSELIYTHLAQALNYLEVMNLEFGRIMNCGSKSLEIKRLINNKFKASFKSNQSA